jgi:hypothetical protein
VIETHSLFPYPPVPFILIHLQYCLCAESVKEMKEWMEFIDHSMTALKANRSRSVTTIPLKATTVSYFGLSRSPDFLSGGPAQPSHSAERIGAHLHHTFSPGLQLRGTTPIHHPASLSLCFVRRLYISLCRRPHAMIQIPSLNPALRQLFNLPKELGSSVCDEEVILFRTTIARYNCLLPSFTVIHLSACDRLIRVINCPLTSSFSPFHSCVRFTF